MFRYGRTYYAYNNTNGRWYSSRGWRGDFIMIDDRAVPRELRRVPRNHWRNYPTAWDGNGGYRDHNSGNGNHQSRDSRDGYRQGRDSQGRDNQGRDSQGSDGMSATLQVRFGGSPHWMGVNGTHVETVPMAERPDYDVFRYSGTYYAYDGNRWYTSARESGQFTMIDDRDVPAEFSRVPREEWRQYPGTWNNANNSGQDPNRGQRDPRGRGGN
jgi:hypothetical protein